MGSSAQTELQYLKHQIEELTKKLAEREAREAELVAGFEKRVEERTAELRRSNEDLQQFAYVSSHDLQEPLRTIVGYTQLLEHRCKEKLDDDAKEFMAYIVDAAQRMSALVNDLLSYSRVANVERVPLRRVETSGVVAGVELNLMKAVSESGAVIKSEDLPVVMGDETQLSQLFQNLIGNAIKYRGTDPPKIQIKAEDQGDYWLFSITDNGIGIDAAYHERIFGLFKRLHGRDVPGTGLGLAICRKIVEKHQGRIWVESELGKGSVFYFTLPA